MSLDAFETSAGEIKRICLNDGSAYYGAATVAGGDTHSSSDVAPVDLDGKQFL